MSRTFVGSDLVKYESDDSHSTLKPREDSLGRLRKENFSLKIRINLLEEFVRSFSDDKVNRSEVDLQKKIIDLEVELTNLKWDLNEKQKLLTEAATAIDLVEKSYADKLSDMAKENQRLLEQASREEAEGARATSDSSRTPSEQGSSTLDPGGTQRGRSVRRGSESVTMKKQTRTFCEQVDTEILLNASGVQETCTVTTSTCGVNKKYPETPAVPEECDFQLRKEYEKGCVAIQSLVSCVKNISAENLSLKQEANSTKMLYLHESRMMRDCAGDLNCTDEDERRARKSMKAQENQFWWSVVTELVTNNFSSPYT